ncbi:hypothetical protein TSUD_101090 [Trifolium subterraneum]|uniref:Uncharacterized protein n=1 Tax=Trifolium subterraneum TaxID=3900 RepID=A0A2Z6NFA2_TRISU|nr:hypothetical protein TSUD_101090 [Trifolium subterraneum]
MQYSFVLLSKQRTSFFVKLCDVVSNNNPRFNNFASSDNEYWKQCRLFVQRDINGGDSCKLYDQEQNSNNKIVMANRIVICKSAVENEDERLKSSTNIEFDLLLLS